MAEGNSKYKVLVSCSTSLVDHFAASDLGTIVTELSSKGLIPYDVYSEILKVPSTPQEKARKIAQAITLTVKAEPFKYVDLVEMLEKQDKQELVRILQDELSTLLFTLLANGGRSEKIGSVQSRVLSFSYIQCPGMS